MLRTVPIGRGFLPSSVGEFTPPIAGLKIKIVLWAQSTFVGPLDGHRFMQRAVFPSSGRVFAFQDGGFCRYPSTGRRRQTGRPNARPRTGCITRRTYFLRIIFKVLRLVYYCASVGADFYSFSYRTSCDLVARDQNLSPLAQPGFWR